MTVQNHLLLIDASGFAYRAFHAATPMYRESDGVPTWAIYGFLQMMWRLLGAASADPPTHAAACFDAGGETFRHKLYPKYKSNRVAGRDEELTAQFPVMRIAADVVGLKPIELPGFEADDIIATLAVAASKENFRTTIVSTDKDFCQLVDDNVIEIVDPVARKRILRKQVREKFGVEPERVIEVQALCGDSVDGYPGVPGIGMRRAAALIREFATAANVVAAVRAKGALGHSSTMRANIRKHAKTIPVMRTLALLRRDVPFPLGVQGLDALAVKPIKRAPILALLGKLECKHKADMLFATDENLERIVDAVQFPFAWYNDEIDVPGQTVPDVPQCGFYSRRLIKGGPFVPIRIWREPILNDAGKPTGKDRLLCTVAGKEVTLLRIGDSRVTILFHTQILTT